MKSNTKIFLLHWICDGQNLSYLKINGVNLLYLIIHKPNGYIEESNENKYLSLVTTDKSKDNKKVWRTMVENKRFC